MTDGLDNTLRKRRLLYVFLGVLVIIIAAAVAVSQIDFGSVPETNIGSTYTVQRRDLAISVVESGEVRTLEAVNIISEADDMKTIVDIVPREDGIHLFMAHHTDPADRKGWLDSIEYLMSLKPQTVVAGHRLAHLPDSPESLQYCHDYLVAFEEALAQANSPDALIAAIQKRFPDVQDMMDGFVLPRSARLAKKE